MLADIIDAILPQTQCQRCGYPDCRAYAEAIVAGETGINRCPPGGLETLNAIARLTGRAATTVDQALVDFAPGTTAFVIEPECIGCTKCIQACPVDAIVGAAKQMHTVIEVLCTGCGLCIPPCPVDCIRMRPARGVSEGFTVPSESRQRADFFRDRYHSRESRQAHDRAEREQQLQQSAASDTKDIVAQRKAEIAAAVARVQAKRAQRTQVSKKHES